MTEYDDSYEFGKEPDWKGEETPLTPKINSPEHELDLNLRDLTDNCVIQVTRFNLLVPFAHDSTMRYVGAVIYQDPDLGFSKKWKIEGKENRFNSAVEASDFAALCIEAERSRMINEEFRKSGI